MNEAKNLALNEAKGEYILFLGVKDRFVPQTLETVWSAAAAAGADTVGFAYRAVGANRQEVDVQLGEEGVCDRAAIVEKMLEPLCQQRLRLPVMGGQVWRWMFSAKLIREGRLSFHGKYQAEELFTLEYLCLARCAAVTEQVLYRKAPEAAVGHRKDLERDFDRYFERKAAIVKKYGLQFPLWRENTLWAGLLMLVENAYHKGSTARPKEKQRTVERLCRREDFAAAVAAFTPEGLHPNRQMTANYIRGKHYFLLTQMYRLKFGI